MKMTEFNILDLKLDLNVKKEDTEPCKGLFFRASKTSWMNCEGLGTTTRLRLLKRMSCKGCYSCDWFEEDFNESQYLTGHGDFPWIGINEIEHGKIYGLSTNSWQDYHGDHDYEVSLVEVKSENNNE